MEVNFKPHRHHRREDFFFKPSGLRITAISHEIIFIFLLQSRGHACLDIKEYQGRF